MKIVVFPSKNEKRIRLRFPSILLVNHITVPILAVILSCKLKKQGFKIPLGISFKAVNEYYRAKELLRKQSLPLIDVNGSDGETVTINL